MNKELEERVAALEKMICDNGVKENPEQGNNFEEENEILLQRVIFFRRNIEFINRNFDGLGLAQIKLLLKDIIKHDDMKIIL